MTADFLLDSIGLLPIGVINYFKVYNIEFASSRCQDVFASNEFDVAVTISPCSVIVANNIDPSNLSVTSNTFAFSAFSTIDMIVFTSTH
ncbi:MAG: hypothetical protein IKY27_03180 [Bacteroidales bacterium]|nr:hypothetical protein [Bacteroidales bacterium]